MNEPANLLQSVDLTEMAREGRLDPVIGRDEEIRRTIQSVCRVHLVVAVTNPPCDQFSLVGPSPIPC